MKSKYWEWSPHGIKMCCIENDRIKKEQKATTCVASCITCMLRTSQYNKFAHFFNPFSQSWTLSFNYLSQFGKSYGALRWELLMSRGVIDGFFLFSSYIFNQKQMVEVAKCFLSGKNGYILSHYNI